MLRDGIFSLVATVVRLLTSLVIFIIMAKAWGPGRFGVFMYPFALAAILVKVADYGFSLQVVRDVGKHPEQARVIMRRAFGAKIALILPTVLATVATGLVIAQRGLYDPLLALLLCDALVNSFAQFLNYPVRALGRFDAETSAVVAGNAALFLLVCAIVALGFGPMAAAAGFVTARLGYLALSWRAYRRVIGESPRVEVDWRTILATLRDGFPFGVHATIGMLTLQADTLMVQHYLGAASVGMYQAGMRVLFGSLIIADALNNVYLATLARVSHHPPEVNRLGTRMTRHLLTLGTMAFACTVGGSEWIVRLLFGGRYDALVPLLPLFGLLMFIRYAGVSYGSLLTLADRQAARVVAICITLVLTIVLNALLIPRYGLIGALGATIASHVLLYAVYIVAAWRDYRTLLIDRRATVLVLLAGLGLLALLAPGLTDVRIRLPLGVVLLVASALLGVTRAEWAALSGKLARVV